MPAVVFAFAMAFGLAALRRMAPFLFLFVPTVVPAVVFLMHHHAGRGGEKEARAEHKQEEAFEVFHG